MAAPLVIAGAPHEPGVDDHPDAREGDARLRHVGGEHDLAALGPAEGAALLVEAQPAVEWDHLERPADRVGAGGDLGPARQEHEHVAGIRRGAREGLGHALGEILRARQRRAAPQVAHVHRVEAARALEVAAAEVSGNPLAVEGGAHHRQAAPALREQAEQEIDVEAPLVQLVEHHVVGALERLEIAQRHARGDEADPGIGAGAHVVPDHVAHVLAQRHALELGDPRREAAAGDPPRLHHHHPAGQPAGDLGRLAAPGRRREHQRRALHRVEHLLAEGVDGELQRRLPKSIEPARVRSRGAIRAPRSPSSTVPT